MRRVTRLVGLAAAIALSATAVSAGSPSRATVPVRDPYGTKAFWAPAAKPAVAEGQKVAVHALRVRALRLDTRALAPVLARAPRENTPLARTSPLVLDLPAPNGKFQRFALQESAIMAPGLAARHPDIKTYSGRGVTDPSATIHADLTPLGFHASVRSAQGDWYVDPYYVGRHAGPLRELLTRASAKSTERSVRRARAERHGPAARREQRGSEHRRAAPHLPARADHRPGLRRPSSAARRTSPPAKVTLMNRVNQVYEDDLSIRHAAGREQRPAQPRHVGPGHRRRTGPAAPRPASRSPRSPAARARPAPGT